MQPIIVHNKSSSKDWPKAPEVPYYQAEEILPSLASKQIEVLSGHTTQIIEIMETQSRYIAELRNEVYGLKKQNELALNHMNNVVRIEDSIKKSVEKIIDESTKLQERRFQQTFENMIIAK